MSEPYNKSYSQLLDVLDVSSEINVQNYLQQIKLNKIITINGVFSNQAETWCTLATNLGFMIYKRSPDGFELLRECNYQKFEVL